MYLMEHYLSQSVELEVVQFVDCAGVNGGAIEDCAGTCEGDAYTNLCGDCVTEDDTLVSKIAGVWGGTSSLDQCGVCDGDNSTCSDCAGVPNVLHLPMNVVIVLLKQIQHVFKIVLEYGQYCHRRCVVYVMVIIQHVGLRLNTNGSAYVDQCGTCDDDSSNDWHKIVQVHLRYCGY